MKLIIGLGNPGEKYINTRHSVGYIVVKELQKRNLSKEFVLRKSGAFMNNSGSFVKKLTDQYSLDSNDLYIIHDDLDLPLGIWKMQYAKGPKVHGGIKDIEQKLGTKDFWRIRVGVDNRNPEERILGEEYVLQDFNFEEKETLDKVIDEICKKLVMS